MYIYVYATIFIGGLGFEHYLYNSENTVVSEKAAEKAKAEADAKAAELAARETEFYANVKKQTELLEEIKKSLSKDN